MPARPQTITFFAGIALGFAGAILAGYLVTDYSKPSHFLRFYPRISLEGAFYPPFSMFENLAVEHWKPGRTVVIVGGNSIFNGVGQNDEHLWSRRLQELLGERYVVVNLALPGAYPSEGAALAVESLIRRGISVLYVANYSPGPVARPYDSIYAYLYWDANYKGRLLANAPRDAEIARRELTLPAALKDKLAAAELAGRLDALLRFNELWHHVSYRYFSTVWSSVAAGDFWKAKRGPSDWQPEAPPLEQRFRDNLAIEMRITQGFSDTFAEPDGVGGWRPTQGPLAQAAMDIDEIFSAPVRARMLIVLCQNCPYYRDQLSPADRRRDTAAYAIYQTLWRAHGVACVTVGDDFEPADFLDRTHLAPSGGSKLAEVVAARIRQLNAQP